jgi:hypothetical protein
MACQHKNLTHEGTFFKNYYHNNRPFANMAAFYFLVNCSFQLAVNFQVLKG